MQDRNEEEDPLGWECGRPDPQVLQGQQSLDAGDGDIGSAFPEDLMLVPPPPPLPPPYVPAERNITTCALVWCARLSHRIASPHAELLQVTGTCTTLKEN